MYNSQTIPESATSSHGKTIEVITSNDSIHYNPRIIKREVKDSLPIAETSNARKMDVQQENQNIRNDLKSRSDGQRKRFLSSWYNLPEFSNWLQESPIPGFAFCQVCRKDLQPGKSELQKHAATAKHGRKMAALGHDSKAVTLRQHIIDLRNDTITKPIGLMIEAMNNAEIKNISYDVDPSVRELEMKSCVLLGKEAALFLPTGQMANLIAVRTHCFTLTSTVIYGDKSSFNNGSMSLLEVLGVGSRSVRNLPDGTLDHDDLAMVLEQCVANGPSTILVCVENTNELLGGQPIGHDGMKKMGNICSQYGAVIHIDGARLINASVAMGETLASICEVSTSVMFEFDRGIGAPGGCVLAGPIDFINRAKLIQKSYGGVMPSAGLLATACLVGLSCNVKRISSDHSNALGIAKGVWSANSSAITVDIERTLTNVVLLKCDNIKITPKKLSERLMNTTREEALEFNESIFIKTEVFPPDKVKLVLHLDISSDDVKSISKKLRFVIREIDQTAANLFSEILQT